MENADEPDQAIDEDDDEDDLRLQIYDEAYARQYENEHTWEQLQEDEHGNLRVDRVAEQRAKRRRLLSSAQSARIRKGMIRYMLLVIDFSRAASVQDLRPNRMTFMLKTCVTFIRDFFNQNPLSQLGILVMRDGVAEKLTDLSGSPEAQIRKLNEYKLGASGDASLQNVLELSLATLKSIPPYGHREVLILFAGLCTCDPGNIFATVKSCKEAKIRVSVVGVAAEVYVCKRIAEDTDGTYAISLRESHLEELMLSHAPPPPAMAANAAAELVLMGFPQKSGEDKLVQVHVGPNNVVAPDCFTCPRCKAKVGELPCACHVCLLTLISSPHLARSYHHLFPVAPFEELGAKALLTRTAGSIGRSWGVGGGAAAQVSTQPASLACYGCLRDLSRALEAAQQAEAGSSNRVTTAVPMVLSCGACKSLFCYECDAYVHESLHNCPGCEVAGGQG